jgi:hypothetical protein
VEHVNRIRTTGQILLVAILLLVAGAAGADELVEVTFGWASCPAADEDGNPCALAVRYEVFLQKGGSAEELVATVDADTLFTLAAERGVVQRIRVIGYDRMGRPSVPSEWSDPIYFDVERTGENPGELPPAEAMLNPNYPNPFNPETRIAYGVPEGMATGTRMALEIFNLRGQRLRHFEVDSEPGWHEVTWDGRDDFGRMQATGTYVTRYICGDKVEVTKMTMVK